MTGADRLTVLLLAPAGSVHTRRWAGALAAAGHRVVVASWGPGPPVPGVTVRSAPAAGARPARRLPGAVRWLRALAARTRPDVVHVHSLGIHGLLSLALPPGTARVVTPWGSEMLAARRSAGRAAVVRLAVRRADLALTTSAAAAAELTSRYALPPGRVRVLSWGVEQALISGRGSVCAAGVRAALGIPPGAIVVLAVRSATATYRTREIVSAFAQARRARPELFLVVLGGHRPGQPRARRAQEGYLRRLRDAGTAAGRVLLVERPLTPWQTFTLMCASDVAVSVPRADQRSSSVLEAALAGCHLLLSDIEPYRELAADGLAADLLPEPVAGALAARLRTVAPDPVARRRNSAFVHAREHGADKTAELERIYRDLVIRGGRAHHI
jgi:glycosyltransferase involved in cell wall biosynthesis